MSLNTIIKPAYIEDEDSFIPDLSPVLDAIANLRQYISAGYVDSVEIDLNAMRPIDEIDVAFGTAANHQWDE